MKILIIYQHFWPDTPPYGNMLRVIAGHLVSKGHSVDVLTAVPSYGGHCDHPEASLYQSTVDGANIIRLRNLPGIFSSSRIAIINKAFFPLRGFLWSVQQRFFSNADYDVVLSGTMPAVIAGLFGSWSAKIFKASYIYQMQDIYPELGRYSGMWSEKGVLYRILRTIDSKTVISATRCIALSDDMRTTLAARNIPINNVVVNNNFMLADFGNGSSLEEPPAKCNCNRRKTIIFAGNLGRFQGLDKILRGFLKLNFDKYDVELLFLGKGKALEGLRKLANDHQRVVFKGHLPFEEAQTVIANATAGIVCLNKGLYKVAYPSKLLSYLGLGVPVLAVVEKESSLSRTVVENRIGVVANSWNLNHVTEAFEEMIERASNENLRNNALKWFDKHGSMTAAMRRWDAMIDDMRGT